MNERISSVFRDIFDDAGLELKDETAAQDIPEWDSLNHIKLVLALEREFGVSFSSDDILGLTCVRDVKRLLHAKGVV